MQLQNVIIKNFRSIQNLELNFKENKCYILVGKNESGKSNVLRALSLLDTEISPDIEDIREGLPSEPLIKEAFVEFEFSLSEHEIEISVEKLKEKILCKNLDIPIINDGEKDYTLLEFCRMRNNGIYYIDIKTCERLYKYYKVSKKYKINGNWKKMRNNISGTISIEGKNVILKNFDFVNTDDYALSDEYVEDMTSETFNQVVWSTMGAVLKENIPSVVSWIFDEKHILPPYIGVEDFASNPDMCIPLKSMFNLAQIEDIQSQINETFSKPNHSFRNLLQRVSESTTLYFREVWKEYKNISFQLIPNGNRIDIGIKDSFNTYGFSQRSDGFKRFVSFLLVVAARAKIKSIENFLILIDEPDLGLHPSGERYLRDELIRMADNNIVLFSTHSIFMVDSNCVNRHLIVEKTNEKTSIIPVNESNYVDEEVIFNALGYSTFQTLKEYNIIFEGWKDKKIFEVAIEKTANNIKVLKTCGVCHVQGVKQILNIVPILDCANRRYIIVTDGDAPAKERQKHYIEGRYAGPWKRYDELVPEGYLVETVEDFIKNKAILTAIDIVKISMHNLPDFNLEFFQQSKSKIRILEEWLKDFNKEERKEIITKIKDILFERLVRTDIDPAYFQMLKNLKELIVNTKASAGKEKNLA